MSKFQYKSFEDLGKKIDSISRSDLDRAYGKLNSLSNNRNLSKENYLIQFSDEMVKCIGYELTFKLLLKLYKKNFKKNADISKDLIESMKDLSNLRVKEDMASIYHLLDEYCY